VTALHLALLALGCSRLRLTASWTMAITHLGLLGRREQSIGPANALTLLRANLPMGRWFPLVAIATDVADGWLARRTTSTAFGAYADGLVDVAFWTRQVWTREPSRALRAAATAAWLLPLSAIGAAYFGSGRTIDYPRPVLVRRLMAGLQCLLAARALAGRLEE
jgi:phosphatidylglycerophosphate synthase